MYYTSTNNANTWPRSLHTMKLNDNLYHFIGAIYEQELTDINTKGINTYQEAIDIRNSYNYSEFKIV